MKTTSRTLHVLMNGILIGHLEKTISGSLIFYYVPEWLTTSEARPISLSLPLVDKPFSGDLVYNFFDNLLPDNKQIRARIQSKFHIATNQPFDLLASIGRDCVGAIQVIEGEIPTFKKTMTFDILNEKEIASILRSYQNNPLGMTGGNNNDFRISIAGAQEKSAFLLHDNQWCRPLKETPTSHIFKLPIGYIQHQQMDLSDSCENEWVCSKIAENFGLKTARCNILYFEDVKVLVVERFDRAPSKDKTWLLRLPQEDMCQALGISPNLKYQAEGGPGIKQIMRVLLGADNPVEDRDTFFKSQVLFWLLAAIDGHAKNFSLFIKPKGEYQLTPLYDIMSAYPLIAKHQLQPQKIKMAMALVGKNTHYHWHNIHRRHYLQTAKAVNYSPERAEVILNEMLQQVDTVIEKTKDHLPKNFPQKISQPIFEGMIKMKNKLESESTLENFL